MREGGIHYVPGDLERASTANRYGDGQAAYDVTRLAPGALQAAWDVVEPPVRRFDRRLNACPPAKKHRGPLIEPSGSEVGASGGREELRNDFSHSFQRPYRLDVDSHGLAR